MLNKILIVGPCGPRKCGIATHINQEYSCLVKQGYIVDILSHKDCNSKFKENLKGFLNPLKILKYYKNYDKIYLHFSPEQYFYTYFNIFRLFNLLPLFSFYFLFLKCKNLIIILHEPPFNKYFFQKSKIHKYIWKRVNKIHFFTESEKLFFESVFHFNLRENQFLIENVNTNFIKFSTLNQYQAIRKLNINSNKKILLAIGFINYNKGFDKIVNVFNSCDFKNSNLYIVGEPTLKNSFDFSYFKSLKSLCQKNPNIFLINNFLSDEDFDIWTIASDLILFPYRSNSNSGVLGRAKLYNKKVIVSNVGGLSNQIHNDDYYFNTEIELEKLLIKFDNNNLN